MVELKYSKHQQEIFFGESQAKYTIVPKGRRFGVTKGAANACIEWMLEGKKLLWVDTIQANLNRYYDRYIYPEIKNINHYFRRDSKVLNIYNGYMDMRSAEKPKSIEGFGYDKIILNEAGIILSNPYLYTNAILPMMLDFKDSQLFALGTPKGKINKDGTEHLFYSLAKSEKNRVLNYTSYDNPFLTKLDIDELRDEIASLSPEMVEQEIYGRFIDPVASNPFAYNYEPDRHEAEVDHSPGRMIYMALDVNISPMAIIFAHNWRDKEGEHLHIFDELEIENASPELAGEKILQKYGEYISSLMLTGDKVGDRREFARRDHASVYIQLKRKLGLRDSQIKLPANPTHENSRVDVNYVLHHHPDFKINPKTCPNTVRDMRIVQVDATGSIKKSNRKDISQRADFLDCVRALVNTYLKRWIYQKRRRR